MDSFHNCLYYLAGCDASLQADASEYMQMSQAFNMPRRSHADPSTRKLISIVLMNIRRRKERRDRANERERNTQVDP